MTSIPEGAVEIPNEPIDLSLYHPSLHPMLGDGMPLKTYRCSNGTIVRIFGASLPKTPEENRRNYARAWEVANRILDRAAVRYALAEEERLKNEAAADSSHPVSDQSESRAKDSPTE